MKIVILAAGKGTRMGSMSESIPKVLMPIKGKPFLYYLIQNIKKVGFKDIGVVVNYKKEKIKEFLEEYNLKATLIEQKQPLGTGDAVKSAKDFVKNENFIVCMGDDLYSTENLRLAVKNDNSNYIFGYKHPNPERFGMLMEKNGFLTEIKEKPKEFVSDLVNIGLYKFTPEIFHTLEKIKKSERGEYELTDALTLLAKKNKVKVIKVNNGWYYLNQPEDIIVMEQSLKNVS